MLRKNFASSRWARVGVFGVLTITAAVIFTVDSADARRYRHRHSARQHIHHRQAADTYSPSFSSIIVDGNSGATLQATSPDAIRHPASLTKIMTLYLLFERLETGKMKPDTELQVSEHASDQAPTKLGLRPGQTIRVEDAIKGLVTRSANDAAVVIAEAIAGDEEDFASMMTRKARSLGMTKTVYRNASGLPDDAQVTTARDQATLGRAIQDRFPRYYRYFATTSFNFRGQSIRNHNRLLGNVEGVDGIKTGYTRASGFNLVSSMRRGNRHLIGVVLGGRSGGSRDAIMRNLLAENLERASTTRTVAAIAERNSSDTAPDVAKAADAQPRPAQVAAVQAPSVEATPPRPASAASRVLAAATAAVPPAQKVEPAPLTNGVIQGQPLSIIPGSSEPMKPVKVKTVQVKAGQVKLASATTVQPVAPPVTSAIPSRPEVAETSGAVVAKAEAAKSEPSRPESARAELPPQPPGHGTGNGILGVLPASAANGPKPSVAQAMASVDQAPRPQPVQEPVPTRPAVHTGWIVQVGALETEGEAQQRIEAARSSARGLLSKADPFTEPVVARDNRKLFRARFAGLERDQAEAVCRTLKRADISCITVRN
ncbi:MAG: serine hydrolase [Bradyrhizobium sp.]|uniref:serine hydrolase n=1 Tax=Bradyrhizobium sp. TaxID=376 RepID=UPI0025BE39B4|nr:serine hydrolase [Bradyrhizobium sp.]MBI5264875.1 serine hydrolase [Bradyrhizobium sp.]